MAQNQSGRKNTSLRDGIILWLSIIGLLACIAVLFPQVRRMIMDLAAQIVHKEISTYQSWFNVLLSYAMGSIFFILFFDYCFFTGSGKNLVRKVKLEIKDCLSEIDYKTFVKPVLLMSLIYLLGMLTIIRANFSYMDDLARSVVGARGWYNWSRHISEFSSILLYGNTNLTDISPLPQLLAILILALSSVLLVYIIGNKKITVVRLLASIPLGLSPFFLECLAFKFDAPYMALSILASIFPFLFYTRKKAFFLISAVSLLVMCMTYQASSGIYMIIVVILCFRLWNNGEKTNKEIFSLLGIAVSAFCFAMLFFRFFLMKSFTEEESGYVSSSMHSASHIVIGTLVNIKDYALTIIHDFSMIWIAGIVLVLLLFIVQSSLHTAQKKIASSVVSTLAICLSFIVSYGTYSLLRIPSYDPRALVGFGVFLAGLCIYVVLDYKKPAIVTVLALNWCFFAFAFSYGNALADQARYAEFRVGILLHDLSALYPDRNRDEMSFQLRNSIDFAPSITNISKHYPVIEKLIPKRLDTKTVWGSYYYLEFFNFSYYRNVSYDTDGFDALNLPVVSDSYYHTIQSDGTHVLITLKH